MIHFIKIKECYADAILEGRKNFEVRLNDRGYNAEDYVVFSVIREDSGMEFAASRHQLNGKRYRITYVHSGLGMIENYVVFGIEEAALDDD